MKYMFSKGKFRIVVNPRTLKEEEVWVMPPWAVERWQRQADTPYAELPESEKESDRQEADKMIEIISKHLDF